jgi:hypothetical protein
MPLDMGIIKWYNCMYNKVLLSVLQGVHIEGFFVFWGTFNPILT